MKNRTAPLFIILLIAAYLIGTSCTDAVADDVSSEVCTDHDHEEPDEHDEHKADVDSDDDHEGHDHEVHEEETDVDDDHLHEEEEDSHDESIHSDAVIELSERDIADAGIVVGVAGAGVIRQSFTHYGEIAVNQERLAHLSPPVAGVVRTIHTELGDYVQEGELIAVIASRELADAKTSYINANASLQLAEEIFLNQQHLFDNGFLSQQSFLGERQAYITAQAEFNSTRQTLNALGVSNYQLSTLSSSAASGELTRYEVRAPISGTVIDLHITPGENIVPESELVTIADLSRVWVSLNVPQSDLTKIQPGQEMTVSHSHSEIPDAVTSIDYVAPVVDHETRTAVVRGELDNSHGLWRPGLFVSASISSGASEEPVVVNTDAVQFLQGEDVVFVPEEHGFVSVPVTLGASDGLYVGITSGLHPGDSYVSEGAFTLKAEVVTSGLDSHAGHGH